MNILTTERLRELSAADGKPTSGEAVAMAAELLAAREVKRKFDEVDPVGTLRAARAEAERLRAEHGTVTEALLKCWAKSLTEVKQLRTALAEMTAERDAAIRVQHARQPDPNAAAVSLLMDSHVKCNETLARLARWTTEHGAQLCPAIGCADTYGEGMRVAKRRVAEILANG